MNRPIFVATIGYIIGIIIGLYFKTSIVLFYIFSLAIVVTYRLIKKRTKRDKRKFKIFSISRYVRYIKLFFNSKNLILIILFSIISNSIVLIKNQKYIKFYSIQEEIEIIGVIISDKESKDFKNEYTIKVIELNKSKKHENIKLYLKTDKKIDLEYGNKVKLKGKYKAPQSARNYGGFDYKEYLKQLEIYGTVILSQVDVLEKNGLDSLSLEIHNIQNRIKANARKNLSKDIYPLYLGLILGDTSYIEEDVEEHFRNSNMSHVLAISGMHISIIIMGCCRLFNKIIGKRKSKIITICILVMYMIITGFSSSIFRASFMGIMVLIGDLIHRKSDTLNSISLSLLIILIINPYFITNIGLQFSYIATIGIIILNKNILVFLEKRIKNKKVREVVSISISAQISIIPISLFHFNTFSIYFLISNLLLGFIIGPIIIICFIFLIFSMFNFNILPFFSMFVEVPIYLITLISNLGFLPLSKIYIRTPKVYEIICYYFLIVILNLIYIVKNAKNGSASVLRFKYTLEVIKYKFKCIRQKTKILVLIGVIIFTTLFKIMPQSLRIHFVDVGQGDCCFIETPSNKTILIDGGGSETGNFNIGKKTLIPYILDRGYTKIDYIFVSHFDTDHVEGLLTVMEELNVSNVIIAKQGKLSENYEKFKEIVNKKKIKTIVVNKSERISIENDLYFDILWPDSAKLIGENVLNNNSMVCKLYYHGFSMLFTGDIEEIAEKQILEEYRNNLNILNSTVLKVGHHGSKTSSTEDFIKAVKAKVAVIGVGKDNKFGHPNDDVIERLEKIGAKIYRTDEKGEIFLEIKEKLKTINTCN